MTELDHIVLNFSPNSLKLLNIVLGFVMFGVALDIKPEDFRNIWSFPKSALLGFFNQYLLFPALTFGLIWIATPPSSIALGLLLVAACPGGNMSNFLTHLSKGNTALSVCLTAFSTVGSILMTPFLFGFWSGLYAPARDLLHAISIDPLEMIGSILLLLGIPIVLGMTLAAKFPQAVDRVRKPIRRLSLLIFIVFLVGAFAANWNTFLQVIGVFFGLILIHNLLALLSGYFSARALGITEADRRAVAIEIAIHNTGLGLILVFTFFKGLGGMALVAAWWGIWDLIVGLALAWWWSRRIPEPTQAAR